MLADILTILKQFLFCLFFLTILKQFFLAETIFVDLFFYFFMLVLADIVTMVEQKHNIQVAETVFFG